MGNGNTHYAIRNTVYELLNTRTWKASLTRKVSIRVNERRLRVSEKKQSRGALPYA